MTLSLDEALAETPVVAIIRGVTPDEVLAVAGALLDGGVRVIEVPMNSPEPLESIRRLGAAMGDRIVHGAGTVLNAKVVAQVAEAGGRIVVSPDTRPEVIAASIAAGLEPMPGFGTASEAFRAYDAGARRLKLFPASSYGPGHLKALRDVLPADASVMPVGGVGADDLQPWWRAGARGFGVGGELFKPGFGPEEVRARAERLVSVVRTLMAGA